VKSGEIKMIEGKGRGLGKGGGKVRERRSWGKW
jgi:hypothetical protein